MSGPCLITIGITCFDAADTVARAVASAAAQDWPNVEIVVVDDGSTDGSRALLRALARVEPRMRLVLHDRNRGCAAARNTILAEAKGDFVAFFDDDDESDPARLRVQHARIAAHRAATGARLVACYASGERVYPNGYRLDLPAIGSRGEIPVGTDVADYLLAFRRRRGVFFGAGTPTCALMADRGTFRATGPFDEALRRQEDADFAIRLARLGGHFVGTPEPLFVQYASAGADKTADVEHQSLLRLLHKNRDHLEARGLYRYMLGWADLRHRHFRGERGRALTALLALGLRFPLRTGRHFAVSALRRFRHERRMRGDG